MIKTALLLVSTLFASSALLSQTPCDLDNTPPALPGNPFFQTNEDCHQFPDVNDLNLTPNLASDVAQLIQSTTINPNAYELYDVEPVLPFADYKALFLPVVPSDNRYFDMDEAYLIDQGNNQLVLVAKVHSRINPNGGLYLIFNFVNGRNWTDWSALNRGYKADLNGLASEHENWMYYEFGECHGVGWGDMEGSALTFTHAPQTYYYGFQVGLGANNNSAEYGCGGWFNFTGTLVDNATGFSYTQTNPIAAAGDVTFNMIPEPISIVETTYTAVDACGNTSELSMYTNLCESGSPILTNIPLNTSVSSICDVVDFVPEWATNCDDTTVDFSVSYNVTPANNGTTQVIVSATYTALTSCAAEPMVFTAYFTINPNVEQLCTLPGQSMDIDQNLVIGTNDLVLFMSSDPAEVNYDFNLSGTQNVSDLLMMIENFGNSTE